MAATIYVQNRSHFWLWMLQRITAWLILPAVFIHMIVLHYVDPDEIIEVGDSALRLKGLLFLIVDSFLLYAGLFHGFNGIRNITYDYVSKQSNRNYAAGAIAAAGLFVLIYGIYGLAYLMLRTDATLGSIDFARSAAMNITIVTALVSVVVLIATFYLWNRERPSGSSKEGGEAQ